MEKANEKKSKQKKPKKNIIAHSICKLAFFAFVGYCLFSIISTQISIAENQDELASLQSKAEELEEKNGEYQRLLSADDEKEYMEQIAIGKLGYAYPNEVRFYDVSRD